ncbi:hypothetical protein HBI25_073390 [Parastagonospora nodorum]|nr:hypothetical protein HBI10_024260 [Parastagonospora nodorum]KAH4022907.1 hypothetical protein HBI13_091880 [Parastagonospora nodorum]KAH4039008.1 hypothetical protein HBI09_042700 [Parastagonospora nodorum]KAH4131416.1 hypothetical protein HBH47_015440 [Parastagonospora nodorum]KAH4232010.1 hypothetical protein HBI06_074520 [Parastagonospora nodorum]
MRKLCNHWKEETDASGTQGVRADLVEVRHYIAMDRKASGISITPNYHNRKRSRGSRQGDILSDDFNFSGRALHHRPATPISRFRNHLVCPPYTRITSASRLQRDPEFCDFSMNLITTAMRERDCAWTRALQSTSRSCDHLA